MKHVPSRLAILVLVLALIMVVVAGTADAGIRCRYWAEEPVSK